MVWATNSGYSKSCAHSRVRNTGCIKRAHTQPIHCNIIAHKDTMIFDMAQIPHPLNCWVLATFFLSATVPPQLTYSQLTDNYSPQYGRWWFSSYFMNNFLSLTFLDPFQPPLNHTTNSIHCPATISTNNVSLLFQPFTSLPLSLP